MKTKLLAFALIALTAGVVLAYPQKQPDAPKPATAAAGKARIDVVFVLDTTSSMGGLIQSAKDNIWSIARTMASAQPTPVMRMGLVAFRDRGDAYVTRITDLSTDLDSMYATLMDYRAEGGGDGPESVNQALYDAVHRLAWSQDGDAYKVIFLVGDAPPHMDYNDDVPYPVTLKAAQAKGIVVNAIQAGENDATRRIWNQIAQLNQGRYFQVAQTGDAVAVHTPFDEQIATLSRELDDTRLFYGSAETQRQMAQRKAAADKLHATASVETRAKRGAFYAAEPAAAAPLEESDLVADVAKGVVDLEKLDTAQLPPPMRELSKDEQVALVEETAEKRAKLQAELKQLAEKRESFIAREVAKSERIEESLDYKIFSAVKAQAAEKGLSYEEAPSY